MNIEEVAHDTPGKDPPSTTGVWPHHTAALVNPASAHRRCCRQERPQSPADAYKAFVEKDMSLLEVNPDRYGGQPPGPGTPTPIQRHVPPPRAHPLRDETEDPERNRGPRSSNLPHIAPRRREIGWHGQRAPAWPSGHHGHQALTAREPASSPGRRRTAPPRTWSSAASRSSSRPTPAMARQHLRAALPAAISWPRARCRGGTKRRPGRCRCGPLGGATNADSGQATSSAIPAPT